jgi:anti-sigma factor RsiW
VEHDQIRAKLSAWHDGELPADLMNSVADHLRNCPYCRKEIEELNRVDLLVRSLPGFEVPEEFVFEMLPGHGGHDTPAMDEFGDFPPLLLSSAFFQVIGL